MERQDSVIDYLLCQEILRQGEAEELRSTYGDDAAAALLIDNSIQEQALLKALAEHSQLPPASYREGLFIERELFQEIDLGLIRTYEFIPVRRRRDQQIDLVVVEPLPPSAQELLELTFGAPIRQYIWPRLRFLHARHYFLGDTLPDWAPDYIRKNPVPLGFAQNSDQIDLHRALQSAQSFASSQWETSQVEEFIKECFDRDALLKVLLGFSARWLTRRLIAVIGTANLQPYFIEDWPHLEARYHNLSLLRETKVELDEAKELRARSQWFSGTAREMGLKPLFQALGTKPPPHLVAVPVQISARTAMLLIGEPTDPAAAIRLDELTESFTGDELQEIAALVGAQLEEIIHQNKTRSLPPPADRIPPFPQQPLSLGLGFDESLVEKMIARRGSQTERHRWEIVDISEPIEEPPEAQQPSDLTVAAAISDALSSIDEPPQSSIPTPLNEAPQHPGATTFGIPAFQEISEPEWANPLASDQDEDDQREDETPEDKTAHSQALEDERASPERTPQIKAMSLQIPVDASGLPMAQIFRRPKRAKRAKYPQKNKKTDQPVKKSSEPHKNLTTGRTLIGTGQVQNLSQIEE